LCQKEGFALNSYELVLIIDPNVGEEKGNAVVTKIEEKIKSLGGQVDKTDKWGIRRLASMIKSAKRLKQAYYVLVRFQAEPTVPAQLRSMMKVMEEVIRSNIARAVEVPVAEIEGAPIATAVEAVNVGEIKGEASVGQS
jgi:small subunit ribosomal protein S6